MADRILITGGAGFVGSHTVDLFIKQGYPVRIFDNLDPQVHPGGKAPDYLNPAAEFIRGDVRDRDALAKALDGIDGVIHLAAKVGVGQSQYDIAEYFSVNVTGTANLLDIIANQKLKIRKILVASSMSAYGEGRYLCKSCGLIQPRDRELDDLSRHDFEMKCPRCRKPTEPVPTTEETELYITSMYALTKKVQEEMTLLFGRVYNIPAVALRYFNIYGPRQSLTNPYTGVAAIFISRLLAGKTPVIYEDGLQSRDFISVYDIAAANLLAYRSTELDNRPFNVGTGEPTSVAELAEALVAVTGSSLKPEITGKFRKGDIRHCYADIEAIRKAAGYAPAVQFSDGMKDLVEWSRNQQTVDNNFEAADRELKEKGLHL